MFDTLTPNVIETATGMSGLVWLTNALVAPWLSLRVGFGFISVVCIGSFMGWW